MAAAAAAPKVKVQQSKNKMVTPASSSPSTTTTTPAASAYRKPLPLLLLSLSLPALLLLLSLVFLLSHTTFSLLICPLLPRLSSTRNATSASSGSGTSSLGVSMDESLRSFHASMPTTTTPSSRNNATISSTTSTGVVSANKSTLQSLHAAAPAVNNKSSSRNRKKKASSSAAKRNRTLLKLLLRSTSQTRRFAARAEELFAGPSPSCTHRFFVTWLSRPLAQFGSRELQVLESLFRWHPGGCLLVASDTMDSPAGTARLRPFLDRGLRVAAASPDFAYLLRGTPAEAWLAAVQRGGVALGTVPLGQNLSNLLRLALLYRYGGAYLDADVVVLRPFFFSGGGLPLQNAIGAQAVDEATGGWRRLNNAVMVFDRAHPLLREFIAEFAAAFDGNRWGHNGPYLVSRVAARHRSTGDLAAAAAFNFTVLPPRAFYPVHWSKIGGMFVAPRDRRGERWVKAKVESIRGGGSFGIHLWNRESRGLEMEEGSVIGTLVSDSCLFCNSSMFVKQG